MRASLSDAIQQALESAVKAGAAPGAVAIVVDRDGAQGLAAAGSTRADDHGVALDVDASFRVASMTKALTSVAALQLVELGKLGLDDTVGSILPAWNELRVLDGWDGDTPRLRPPTTSATVRQLLSHTAGHGYFFFNEDLVKYHEACGVPNVLSGLRAALSTPLLSDPGTRWEYGINTDWLGLVIEDISGQRLDDYLTDHLLVPLGMTSTTFTPTTNRRDAMMPVHMRTADGALVATDLDLAPQPEWMAGGHGAVSTASDYGRFISMLLRGGTSPDGAHILDSTMIDVAFSDQLGGLPYPDVINTVVPEMSNSVVNLPVRQSWGLGFHLTLEDLPGLRRAGTGDWAGIFNCYYWVDRGSNVGGAFLTQVLPFFDDKCVNAAVSVEAAAYDQLRPA